jgi:hypothetical protein
MPDRPHRLAVALAVGSIAATLTWVGRAPPSSITDFDTFWVAGRAVAHGASPYQAVAGAGSLQYPYWYPATAAVLLAPFGLLFRHLAATLWAGLGFALLAYAVTARGWWRLGMVASAPAVHALLLGQWSPLIVAACALPWLGLVWAAKPSVGLACAVAYPSRQAAIGCAILIAASFLLAPGWVGEWRATLAGAPYFTPPVLRPFGIVLLAAWLRWRTPEGRLLGSLAVVPHTTTIYELLPLALVARTPRQLAAIVILGYGALLVHYRWMPYGPTDVPGNLAAEWPWILSLGYLPALIISLRSAATVPGVQSSIGKAPDPPRT